MFDIQLSKSWDIALDASGDIRPTESVVQAVKIRLLWFLGEWRLIPALGFGWFEYVFVKNPNVPLIIHLLREAINSVEGVRSVGKITIAIDAKTRIATIGYTFSTAEDDYWDEVKIWQNTD